MKRNRDAGKRPEGLVYVYPASRVTSFRKLKARALLRFGLGHIDASALFGGSKHSASLLSLNLCLLENLVFSRFSGNLSNPPYQFMLIHCQRQLKVPWLAVIVLF